MNRVVILDDGRVVRIRPLAADDGDRSLAFFTSLAEDERRYFRRDVTRREVIEERIHESLNERVDRIVAVYENRIVADGSLVPEQYRWAEGSGEIRLFVAMDFRRCGLGTRMVRELYVLAHKRDLARITVRFMAPLGAAREIFRRLGFDQEFIIPRHVRDSSGEWQDLVIMRCDLETLMEEPVDEGDLLAEQPAIANLSGSEIDTLRRFALRWAVLAAWYDDLETRRVAVPETLPHKLEESRVIIASGCFGSCDVGTALEEIEGQLVSADASVSESKVDLWMDILGKAMSHPDAALGLAAVRFRFAESNRALCGCGVAV